MSAILREYGLTLAGRDISDFSYRHETLGQVLTIQEVSRIWGVGRTALLYHIHKGRIDARLALTGGSTLLLKSSVIELYGSPEHDELATLHYPERIVFEGKRK